jgi:AraC-like DNA-binding protein
MSASAGSSMVLIFSMSKLNGRQSMIFENPSQGLLQAVDALSSQFLKLPWDFRQVDSGRGGQLVSQWLGAPDEDIQVVAFDGEKYLERYHRQDFFFINFVVQSGYDVMSAKYGRRLHLSEGDVYIGQPYSGYALRIDGGGEVVMIGLHMKKELFLREYLAVLARDAGMFHFFLDPQTDRFSDEYIRLHFDRGDPVWDLVGLMAREYAGRRDGTQDMLHAMMMSMTLMLSRRHREGVESAVQGVPLEAQMEAWIDSHSDSVTLESLSARFGYHPAYVSAFLKHKAGRGFKQILLEKRMAKAKILLEGTDLAVEDIASMVGYANPSSFYKAFGARFGGSPSSFRKQGK